MLGLYLFVDRNNDSVPQTAERITSFSGFTWPSSWTTPVDQTGNAVTTSSGATNADFITYNISNIGGALGIRGWRSIRYPQIAGNVLNPNQFFGRININFPNKDITHKVALEVRTQCFNKVSSAAFSLQNDECVFPNARGGTYWSSTASDLSQVTRVPSSNGYYYTFSPSAATAFSWDFQAFFTEF